MPVWHEATKQLVEDGKLVVLGVVQEQHADRCRLFAQWKGIDWPILHDVLNLVGPDVVPIYIAIDEHGVVRDIKPEPATLAEEFVARTFSPLGKPPPNEPAELPDLRRTGRLADDSRQASNRRAHADALVLSGEAVRLKQAIADYRRVVKSEKKDADAHFRLGVALRKRFDSPDRQPGDFQSAVDAWQEALRLRPNQYIFRRRIQQYGPRLDKPYPFYGWIHRAREEITARGDEPVPLRAEPVGAELAAGTRGFKRSKDTGPSGDPDGKVNRDEQNLIQLEPVAVRASDKKQRVVQVHIAMRPNASLDAHWNNEAEPLRIWIEKPEGKGLRLSRRFAEFAKPEKDVSEETRSLNFEVQFSKKHKGEATVKGYALYNVCRGKDGKCLFKRQDFEVALSMK